MGRPMEMLRLLDGGPLVADPMMAGQRQRQQPLERPMEMLRLLDGGPLVLSTTSDNVSRTAATEAGCGNTSTVHDSWAAIRRMNLLRPIKIRGLDFKIGLETQHRSS